MPRTHATLPRLFVATTLESGAAVALGREQSLYLAGVLIYIAAWGLLILAPDSSLARTPAAFLAPAYTPLLWLAGIALVGDRLFASRISWRWWIYLVLSALFVAFHVGHAALIYERVLGGAT